MNQQVTKADLQEAVNRMEREIKGLRHDAFMREISFYMFVGLIGAIVTLFTLFYKSTH